MKAIEYFAKYKEGIMEEAVKDTATEATKMLIEISQEVDGLYKRRMGATNKALCGCLLEINNKWNAICRLFEKNYKCCPLKKDGFIIFWKDRMPEIRAITEGRK